MSAEKYRLWTAAQGANFAGLISDASLLGLFVALGWCKRINGFASAADLARRFGYTRASISFYKRRWQLLIDDVG
jgi:hypothetical protein